MFGRAFCPNTYKGVFYAQHSSSRAGNTAEYGEYCKDVRRNGLRSSYDKATRLQNRRRKIKACRYGLLVQPRYKIL